MRRHLRCVLWVLAAACSGPNQKTPTPPATSPAGSPPVTEAAMWGLLLSPADINTAMHSTGMTIAGQINQMWDDSAEVPDKDCRFADGPAEAPVYAGSGWTAVRGGSLQQPGHFTHFAGLVVVSFPSADDAAAFFTASSERWPACANRQYTLSSGQPIRRGVDRGAGDQHQRHAYHHQDSRGHRRLELRTSAERTKQRRHRRHRMQQQLVGLGSQHRRSDRRQGSLAGRSPEAVDTSGRAPVVVSVAAGLARASDWTRSWLRMPRTMTYSDMRQRSRQARSKTRCSWSPVQPHDTRTPHLSAVGRTRCPSSAASFTLAASSNHVVS